MFLPVFDGAVLAVSVAAPFGPVSLLCVHRSLADGPYLGTLSGLGSATAHGVFAGVAIGGASAVAYVLSEWRGAIHLLSAGLLVALGLRILWCRPAPQGAGATRSPGAAYLGGLTLALVNPMTILPYLAFASAFTTRAVGPAVDAFLMVPGVVLGAACWYGALSGGASVFRHRAARVVTRHLSLGAGVALIGFGVLAAFK